MGNKAAVGGRTLERVGSGTDVGSNDSAQDYRTSLRVDEVVNWAGRRLLWGIRSKEGWLCRIVLLGLSELHYETVKTVQACEWACRKVSQHARSRQAPTTFLKGGKL